VADVNLFVQRARLAGFRQSLNRLKVLINKGVPNYMQWICIISPKA
jgi:hypothetical protein